MKDIWDTPIIINSTEDLEMNKNALSLETQIEVFNRMMETIKTKSDFNSLINDRQIDVILFLRRAIEAHSRTRRVVDEFHEPTWECIALIAINSGNTTSLVNYN